MCKKNYCKIIFVVLTYRNTIDLEEFFKYNSIPNSKTIVVNSYYDEDSEYNFKEIAIKNNADFISVPNKGYGYGNNIGIEHAFNNYDFEYLIISNADIIIEQFDQKSLVNKKVILAPKLLTMKGKNQNPSSAFKPIALREKLLYKTYKYNHNKLIYLFYALSRLSKIIYYCISRFRKYIYSPHGAFIIFPKDVISKIKPIFNDNMFLFYEESHLGKLSEQMGIKTIYDPSIIIRHKEDGSIKLLSENQFSLMKKSYMIYFNYWNNMTF